MVRAEFQRQGRAWMLGLWASKQNLRKGLDNRGAFGNGFTGKGFLK
jgi:hypothetical protein